MSVTNHTIAVTVGGVDKTAYLKKDSLFVRFQLNNKSNIAELKFSDYEPTDRAEVQISVNGTVVFGGYVVRKSASIIGVKNASVVVWSVECKDWSELLETATVTEEFTITSDSGIIDSLFTDYLPSAGFNTTTDVSTLDPDLDISFTGISLREALDQLAKRVGANWYIKPNKNVYWFNPQTPQEASFGISSNPDNATTFGFLNNSLSYDIDSSTIINQVKIASGLKSTGAKQTDAFTGDGSKKTFLLSQIPDSVLYCSYTANEGSFVTYGSFVGYAPQDKLLSDGGSFTAILDVAARSITLEGNTGDAPRNGSAISVVYYYKEQVNITYNNEASQSAFGTYPYTIENKEFVTEDEVSKTVEALLEQNSYGKATVKFDTTKYGLFPGQLVTISVTELGLTSALTTNLLLLENGDQVLLENGGSILLEEFALGQDFLVQEVSLTPVVTGTNQFMIVCSVTAGKYSPTIVDSLASLTELRTTPGKAKEDKAIPVRLSNISADMGEVNLGRAVFTDGGTARFRWSDPGGASGVVIGLEDTNNTYGALYIYDGGDVKAKLGRLDDRTAIGTIQPSGWGLWTENGYFTGIVGASEIVGGTVRGSLISGGTVEGNLVTGGTILGPIIIGGTIATGTPPINSSNPGVYMDSTGLYGYGSAGLTFRLASDPAIKPWFSSGTILNTTYEINTSAVLRTGTTNPRIQIDNSGIFAYDSGGNLRFTVDVSTGRLTASQGTFSGTVSASTLTGNTISAGTVTGNLVSGGTVTGALVTAGTVSGNVVSGGTVTGSKVIGGTVTGGLVSGGTVSGAIVTGGTVQSASGNVYLDSGGLNLVTTGSYTYGDQRNIKWRSSVGGSIAVELASSWNSTFAEFWVQAGYPNSRYGIIHQSAYNSSGFGYTEIQQYPTQITYLIDGNSKIQLDTNFTSWVNIIPDNSANNRQLGDSTHGFRYLYLKDDNGSVRRVSINSSGVLTVT